MLPFAHLRTFRRSLHLALKNTPALVADGLMALTVGLIMWAHIATPPFLVLTGFYLIPIHIAIWYCRRGTILLVIGAAIATSFYTTWRGIPLDTPLWEEVLAYLSIALVFLVFSILMSSLKSSFHRLKEENQTDALTGLRSRRNFLDMAQFEFSRAARSRDSFTLAMIDLDNFKHVNDTQGHAAGDALLVAVSRCITSNLREIDIVGRLGGDEFAILLPGGNLDQAIAVFERLHASLKTLLHSFSPLVSASIGAVFVPSGTTITVGDAIEKADAVMYSVKHEAKNSVLVRSLPSLA